MKNSYYKHFFSFAKQTDPKKTGRVSLHWRVTDGWYGKMKPQGRIRNFSVLFCIFLDTVSRKPKMIYSEGGEKRSRNI